MSRLYVRALLRRRGLVNDHQTCDRICCDLEVRLLVLVSSGARLLTLLSHLMSFSPCTILLDDDPVMVTGVRVEPDGDESTYSI